MAMNRAFIVLILWATSAAMGSAQERGATERGGAAPSRSKIHKLEELTWPQNRRARTSADTVHPPGRNDRATRSTSARRCRHNWRQLRGKRRGETCQRGSARLDRGHDAGHQLRPGRSQSARRHAGPPRHLRYSTIDAAITGRRCRRTARAEQVQMDFRAERSRRAHAQHCHRRSLRLRQRNIWRDDASSDKSLSRR